MNLEKINELLHIALKQLYNKDSYLIDNDASERSITFKLAEYLQHSIGDGYNVDCEYNRHILDESGKKRIYILKRNLEEVLNLKNKNFTIKEIFEGEYCELSVFPDIIIHTRGSTQNNLLAIEVKKNISSVDKKFDFLKLQCYTDDSEVNSLHYTYGAFICLNIMNPKDKKPEIIWFSNGKKL
jgi:hypothetical protein